MMSANILSFIPETIPHGRSYVVKPGNIDLIGKVMEYIFAACNYDILLTLFALLLGVRGHRTI